jgi:hypothetical protein
MLVKQDLEKLYLEDKVSMMEIADQLGCSIHKVAYWMDKHDIKRRSISDAIYQKHNPNGDPFSIQTISSRADAKLYGLGVGLYWGEGTKASKHSVKLGNTDPALIKAFMQFLIRFFKISQDDFKFGLQIFSDINPVEALSFWIDRLGVKPSQFYKPTVTISGSIGTYRRKSQYGVVTLHYHNKKLRDILVGMLPR